MPVDELNSGFQDTRANVSHHGLDIFFDSTRDGGAPDIWTARRPTLPRPWSAARKLDSNVNSGNHSDIYVAMRLNPGGAR